MAELILHHHDPSPFAEKIRLVFGLKNLEWSSVQVPMIMPKPDLTRLTIEQGLLSAVLLVG